MIPAITGWALKGRGWTRSPQSPKLPIDPFWSLAMPTLITAPIEWGLKAHPKTSWQPMSSSYLRIPGLRNHLSFPFCRYFSARGKVSLWQVLLFMYEAVAKWAFQWPSCKTGWQRKSCDFKGDKRHCVFSSPLPLPNDHLLLSLKPRDEGQTQIEEGSWCFHYCIIRDWNCHKQNRLCNPAACR